MVPLGLNQAATVRVGLAHGAGNAEGVSRAGWTAFVIGVSFMALMALVMILWPHLLISAFLSSSSAGESCQQRQGSAPQFPSIFATVT